MADKDILGRSGEERAATYLTLSGYDIVDRNWRCTEGEIDIVAVHSDSVVVVEVKTRRTDWFGHPFEAVDRTKRARLWRLGCGWVAAHPQLARGRRLRLDVIGITGGDPRTAILEHLVDIG